MVKLMSKEDYLNEIDMYERLITDALEWQIEYANRISATDPEYLKVILGILKDAYYALK